MKKKIFILATIAIAYVATATAKTSWPTTDAGKYPSWPVSKYPVELKFPKFPSWPTEPVSSWPAL